MSRLLDVVSTVKESSPAESVLSCPDLVMVEPATLDDFQDAMTTSQYAQVKLVVLEANLPFSQSLVDGGAWSNCVELRNSVVCRLQ